MKYAKVCCIQAAARLPVSSVEEGPCLLAEVIYISFSEKQNEDLVYFKKFCALL
jgi:hypothetical protein